MFSALLLGALCWQDPAKMIKELETLNKPKLLIVGCYHFSNPGLDLVKADLDDHLSPKRQAEIQEVNESLAKFNPTKIAVEASPNSSNLKTRFEGWIAGKIELSSNESEQIGFRLAKQFGHQSIYGVDQKLDLDFESLMKDMTPEAMTQFQKTLALAQSQVASYKQNSVAENLRSLNAPESDRAMNGLYLRFLLMGKSKPGPAAELVSNWYKRNIQWLANLSNVITDSKDRVLLICGAGHASLIRSILRDSLDYDVLPTIDYLPKSKN